MSAAVDANVLLYASDESSAFHRPAHEFLTRAAASSELLYLFWPVVMGYLRIATHPAVFARPLAPAAAISNIEALASRPQVRVVGEGDGFWRIFQDVLRAWRRVGTWSRMPTSPP